MLEQMTSDQADNVLRIEYFSACRAYAKELKEQVENKEITSGDELEDSLRERVDNSLWIIYTSYNFQVLRYSPYQDTYMENFGEAPIDSCGNINWAALAEEAMIQDIKEFLPDYDWKDMQQEDEEEDE